MNIIDAYRQFKIYHLKKLCKIIYNQDNDMIDKELDRFIENYFNAKYYHLFETLDDNSVYTDKVLKEEYTGLEYELIDDYGNNDEVKVLSKIAYFVCLLDTSYENREELDRILREKIEENDFIKEIIENRIEPFIKYFIKMYEKEIKFYSNETDNYFELTYKVHDNLKITELGERLTNLDNIYKRYLINQAYNDEKIYLKKVQDTLNKISFNLLKDKYLDQNQDIKYLLLLNDEVVKDGDFIPEIKDLMNNDFFASKVTIGLTDDVLATKQRIFKNKVKLACYRDLSYINDIDKKMSIILPLPIEYFVIMNYKVKDKETITSYIETDKRIIFYEEEE